MTDIFISKKNDIGSLPSQQEHKSRPKRSLFDNGDGVKHGKCFLNAEDQFDLLELSSFSGRRNTYASLITLLQSMKDESDTGL